MHGPSTSLILPPHTPHSTRKAKTLAYVKWLVRLKRRAVAQWPYESRNRLSSSTSSPHKVTLVPLHAVEKIAVVTMPIISSSLLFAQDDPPFSGSSKLCECSSPRIIAVIVSALLSLAAPRLGKARTLEPRCFLNKQPMAAFSQPRHRNDFEIAIICALHVESDAVETLFDEFWEDIDYGKAPGDINAYALGRIGRHDVILVHMPGMGKVRAAAVASSCRHSFPHIKLALIVGICGGVPNGTDDEKEVLLGDVIISTGLVQYDFGRRFDHRFVRKDSPENNLSRPKDEIQGFLNKLQGQRSWARLRGNTSHYLAALCQERNFENARYLGTDEDRLFEAAYRHKHHNLRTCSICTKCITKGMTSVRLLLNYHVRS
jgi:nucleoside phosphorylase